MVWKHYLGPSPGLTRDFNSLCAGKNYTILFYIILLEYFIQKARLIMQIYQTMNRVIAVHAVLFVHLTNIFNTMLEHIWIFSFSGKKAISQTAFSLNLHMREISFNTSVQSRTNWSDYFKKLREGTALIWRLWWQSELWALFKLISTWWHRQPFFPCKCLQYELHLPNNCREKEVTLCDPTV